MLKQNAVPQYGTPSNVVSFEYAHLCCRNCDMRQVCPSNRLGDSNAPGRGMLASRTVARGEHLFRQGDTLRSLYVVRSGSVKTYLSTRYGLDHVVRFYLPGEVVGLDALADTRHPSSAQALEISSVCRIALDAVDGNRGNPKIQRQLLKLASQEMVSEHARSVMLAQRDAGERLATFLLQLSQRYAKRGYSDHEFNLSMSRQDIASLLALAVETVSRLFTHFQSIGLISVERRHIRILSPEGLRNILTAEGLRMAR